MKNLVIGIFFGVIGAYLNLNQQESIKYKNPEQYKHLDENIVERGNYKYLYKYEYGTNGKFLVFKKDRNSDNYSMYKTEQCNNDLVNRPANCLYEAIKKIE